MKSLKKCFGLGVGRKSGLSFAMLAGGSLALLLCVSCASGKAVEQIDIEDEERGINMVQIPGESYCIMDTEVTQEIYESVMGENPSNFKGEKNLPVECVSWYDAVVFCNKLSVMDGLAPVYSVSNKTDVSEWDYVPHKGNSISKGVECNKYANGYRLPTLEEWQYAARGGQKFEYSGSDNLDEVGWYDGNSGDKTHPVAQKKSNGYGLYDMSGNVWEWCWDSDSNGRYYCGGSWDYRADRCEVGSKRWNFADYTSSNLGFRIVRNIDE